MQRVWTIVGIVVIGGISFLTGCDGLFQGSSGSDGGDGLTAEAYFPATPGFGVKYQVTDDHASRDYDGSVWAVLQSVDVAAGLDRDYALVQSYVDVDVEGGTGRYRNSVLAGALRTTGDGSTYFILGSGLPVGNQAHYPRILGTLPEHFEDGDSYNVDWSSSYATVNYTVESLGDYTVRSSTFSNCIKVTADVPDPDDAYYEGSGWAVLAPETGIVELSFTRADGTDNTYEYETSNDFATHTISGTVTTDGTNPAENYIVAIATRDVTSWVVTDNDGKYSISAYGPAVQFSIGLDDDRDHTIDFNNSDDPYPKEYTVRDVTSDMSGIDIDLSSL